MHHWPVWCTATSAHLDCRWLMNEIPFFTQKFHAQEWHDCLDNSPLSSMKEMEWMKKSRFLRNRLKDFIGKRTDQVCIVWEMTRNWDWKRVTPSEIERWPVFHMQKNISYAKMLSCYPVIENGIYIEVLKENRPFIK